MKRLTLVGIACFLLAGCATEGTGGSADFYGGYAYGDWWYGYGYGGGCCIDYPGDIGPPARPEHPIALPPGGAGAHPEHPIATPPKAEPKAASSSSSRSMPSPRPAAPMRSGGGRGGGGRR